MTDYKRFFIRVKKVYPFITKELNVQPVVTDYNRVPDLFVLFQQITGHSAEDIAANKTDSQLLFLAVVVLLYDPLFFDFDQPIINGLRKHLQQYMGGKYPTVVSQRIRRIRDLWKVYPGFRDRVHKVKDELTACLVS